MRDFEAFQTALVERRSDGGEGGPGYMDSLMNSMSLVLDEFYKHLRVRSSFGYGGKERGELMGVLRVAGCRSVGDDGRWDARVL